MNKQYYKGITFYQDRTKISYWCATSLEGVANILSLNDFVIPLGNKKPNNIAKENIKTC